MSIFKRLIPTILMLVFEAVIGVLLLINGERFTQIVFIIFGVVLLICGLVTLIRSLLQMRGGGSLSMLQLMLSVVLLAVGAFFTAASGSVLSIVSAVTLVIGIIIAFNGMLKLVEFASMRRYTAVTWVALIGAIVTIAVGLVIAFNPFGATELMWTMMGILIILSAVFDIISLILFGIALKKALNTTVEVEVKEIDE